MKIRIKTRVKEDFSLVVKYFNEDLFRYLLPPGSKLILFEGNSPGSRVHLEFTFPFKTQWVSEIIEENKSQDTYSFIDVGRVLPYGLDRWRHRHCIVRDGSGSRIVDEMNFTTGKNWLDVLYYPFLYAAFLPRKASYVNYFKKVKNQVSIGGTLP